MADEIIISTREEAEAAAAEIEAQIKLAELALQQDAMSRALNPGAPIDLDAARKFKQYIDERCERAKTLHAAVQKYIDSRPGD